MKILSFIISIDDDLNYYCVLSLNTTLMYCCAKRARCNHFNIYMANVCTYGGGGGGVSD